MDDVSESSSNNDNHGRTLMHKKDKTIQGAIENVSDGTDNTKVKLRAQNPLNRFSRTLFQSKHSTYLCSNKNDEVCAKEKRPQSMFISIDGFDDDKIELIDTKGLNETKTTITKDCLSQKSNEVVVDIEQISENVTETDHYVKSEKVKEKQKKQKNRKMKKIKYKDEAKDTWSTYLDPQPKRHEVFCALSSRRIRAEERSSVQLQRRLSNQILLEKKRSMRLVKFCFLIKVYKIIDKDISADICAAEIIANISTI